jgi:hypothetical protein
MQPRWLPSSHRRDSFEPAPVPLAGLGVERGQGAPALREKNTAAWSMISRMMIRCKLWGSHQLVAAFIWENKTSSVGF